MVHASLTGMRTRKNLGLISRTTLRSRNIRCEQTISGDLRLNSGAVSNGMLDQIRRSLPVIDQTDGVSAAMSVGWVISAGIAAFGSYAMPSTPTKDPIRPAASWMRAPPPNSHIRIRLKLMPTASPRAV